MKRIVLLMSLIMVFTLAACDIDFDLDGNDPSPEPDYLTHEELEAIIDTLITARVIESEIINIVEQHVPHDLTLQELIQLIESLLPEDRHTTSYDLEGFQASIVSMLEDRAQSVIGIRNINPNSGGGIGSGVIYKAEMNAYEGGEHLYYVVTNHHVVENHQQLEVVYEKFGVLNDIPNNKIDLLGSDATTDIAVLTFRSTEVFQTVDFADSYEISAGQFVFAIGNPLGFQYYGSVTMGIISGTARFLTVDDFNATVIQHDASISPGNSGGALFDINGQIIGINHMKLDQAQAANIGFAVPSNTVRRIAQDLEDYGYIVRPYLGIVSNVFYSGCDYPSGACIQDVDSGGAADSAGLVPGDTIIGYKHQGDEAFVEVRNFNELREMILNSRVGDVIILQYVRNGEIHVSPPTTLNPHPDDQLSE